MTWQSERIEVPTAGGDGDEYRQWVAETSRAFLQGRPSDGWFDVWCRVARHDGQRPFGVMEDGRIVGTFCEFPWTLDLGRGSVPFWAITDVTVRPTHRRRGMLRGMMTDSLERAVLEGMPLAGLTVSEGGIYRRFGFGMAGDRWKVDIAARDFQLVNPCGGTFELVEPVAVGEWFDDVARRTRAAWPGVHPMGAQREIASASYDFDGDKVPTDRYAVVHRATDGDVDGVAVWRHDRSADRGTLMVESLWGEPGAVFGLLEFCCRIDLIEVVRLGFAPPPQQLRASLIDPRAVTVTHQSDAVWLRPLDVPACVAARPWGADGVVMLRVDDPLGHAAGTWRITVVDGCGRAERAAADEPALGLGVDALGSLLGEGRLADLIMSGRVEADAGVDRASASRVFGSVPSTWHNVFF